MIGTLAKNELRVLSRSAFAWIAAGLLQLVFGWIFLTTLENFTLAQSSGNAAAAASIGLTSIMLTHWLSPVSLVLLFASPLICMHLIAEERRSGRYQLLASSPVSAVEITLGKFFGALGFQYLLLAINLLLAVCLHFWTQLDINQLLCAMLGLALLLAMTTATSLFFSSLTTRPVIAGFCSLITLLMLWLLTTAGSTTSGSGLYHLSPATRLHSFMQGILSVGDIIYFVILTAMFLLLCSKRLAAINSPALH